MINRVVLVGRLTKDPELKYMQSGVPMTRFTVAVNRFKKEGEEQQADFISCIAWRKQAENLANFMKKGNQIGVEGRIQTGSFEGQDGKRVYTTDVVADSVQFLEPRAQGSTQTQNSQTSNNYQQNSQNSTQPNPYGTQQNYTRMDEDPFASSKGPIEVKEDDLPF